LLSQALPWYPQVLQAVLSLALLLLCHKPDQAAVAAALVCVCAAGSSSVPPRPYKQYYQHHHPQLQMAAAAMWQACNGEHLIRCSWFSMYLLYCSALFWTLAQCVRKRKNFNVFQNLCQFKFDSLLILL
jgi:hypothetical protein